MPSGRDRRPKSKWWNELLETISASQSATIRVFLTHIRNNLLSRDGGLNEALTAEAETFWDAQILSATSRTRR
jgi:hypothetical protein